MSPARLSNFISVPVSSEDFFDTGQFWAWHILRQQLLLLFLVHTLDASYSRAYCAINPIDANLMQPIFMRDSSPNDD